MSRFGKKYQVFVSSTYTDLLPERQAAVEAILKAGHIPAGMELFSAGNESQLKTIYRWIDQCDIYMLILGGRYGSLEPETKVSYTELEYDYASNADIPMFSVVIHEDALDEKVRTMGKAALEQDNPAQLKQFRQKVLGNVSSFFSDAKDVKLAVHESLGDLSADNELVGWVYASDIPDTSALSKELVSLREENRELKSRLKVSNTRSADLDDDFDELVKLLRGTQIIIPKEITSTGNAEESNLLSILLMKSDALVSGVTSSLLTDASRFLYTKVFPKLQVHGLAENEKVAGVRYRRSFISKKGLKFLSTYTRKVNAVDELTAD